MNNLKRFLKINSGGIKWRENKEHLRTRLPKEQVLVGRNVLYAARLYRR